MAYPNVEDLVPDVEDLVKEYLMPRIKNIKKRGVPKITVPKKINRIGLFVFKRDLLGVYKSFKIRKGEPKITLYKPPFPPGYIAFYHPRNDQIHICFRNYYEALSLGIHELTERDIITKEELRNKDIEVLYQCSHEAALGLESIFTELLEEKNNFNGELRKATNSLLDVKIKKKYSYYFNYFPSLVSSS